MSKEEVFKVLDEDCQFYLSLLKNCRAGHFLVRGYFYDIPELKQFEHNLERRTPKNMPPDVHNKINDYFEPLFDWKIRNGIFCYGFDMINKIPRDLGYGNFYLFFPIGPFDFVYSPDHFDLFGSVNQSKEEIGNFIKNLKFENSDFCEVMNVSKEYDYFGNEVSIRSRSYYLVNPNFVSYLTSKIWY